MSGDNQHIPKDMPFIMYTYQIEFFSHIINRILIDPDDILSDKSRDMGATWLVMAAVLWCWLVVPNFQAYLGSRIEPLVDNWMKDSHFGKLRYMLQRLPPFLKPAGLQPKVHDTKLNLYNPQTGGAIQGAATSPNFARQGRYNVVVLDEFAAWEYASEAWTSCGDSTTCRIPISTPQGLVNEFASIRFSKTTQVLSFHWTLNPEKVAGLYWVRKEFTPDRGQPTIADIVEEGTPDARPRSPWYDKECRRRKYKLVAIAQELDIDYIASGRPVFDMTAVKARIEELRSHRPVITRGKLVWKVDVHKHEDGIEEVTSYAPKFNERGTCINRSKLQVVFRPSDTGDFLIHRFPDDIDRSRNRYTVCADVAEGLEQGDWDDAVVSDRSSGDHLDMVAEFHAHLSPHLYAIELVKLAVFYGYAPLWVEKNNQGIAVIEKAFELYPNIGHEKYQDVGPLIEFSEKMGWKTTPVSKPIMIDALDEYILQGLINDPFISFWEECQTFVRDPSGRLSAQNKGKGGEYFDDRVISRAIAIQANKYLPMMEIIPELTEEEILKDDFDDGIEKFREWMKANEVEQMEEDF
jgi:hypothetical protein